MSGLLMKLSTTNLASNPSRKQYAFVIFPDQSVRHVYEHNIDKAELKSMNRKLCGAILHKQDTPDYSCMEKIFSKRKTSFSVKTSGHFGFPLVTSVDNSGYGRR